MRYERFIRQNKRNLETSITFYQKNESKVSLISCIHIGEEDYFKTLESKANEHDFILYEPFNKNEVMKKEADSFGLAFQPFVIDYSNLPNKWINAEDTVETKTCDIFYSGLVIVAGILFFPVMQYHLKKNSEPCSKEDNIQTQMKFLFSTPYKQLNNIIGKSFEPRRRSAIKNFEGLNKSDKSVAILYGACHAPYFEKYLLKKGYVELSNEWIIAEKVSP